MGTVSFKKVFTSLILFFTVILTFASCKGENGADGKDGATWHNGSGAPMASLDAALGDYYIDVTTCDIYTLGGEGWNFILNVKGEAGKDGIDGENGTADNIRIRDAEITVSDRFTKDQLDNWQFNFRGNHVFKVHSASRVVLNGLRIHGTLSDCDGEYSFVNCDDIVKKDCVFDSES